MHLRGSIVPFPLIAFVGQAATQTFLHHSGQPGPPAGESGANSRSTTTVSGSTQELWSAALPE